MKKIIKLGTRGSALALIQAQKVQTLIQEKFPDLQSEIVIIHTEGDLDKKTPISKMGGKSMFCKAIENALLENKVDIAIHSLKDVTSRPPEELTLCGFLKAESNCDALILSKEKSFNELPKGSTLATSSLRRKALIKKMRPDIICVDIRGNVETRIKKTKENYDGLILSEAGLIRLKLEKEITESFNPNEFIPAPGQGVIALQTRKTDKDFISICLNISDPAQMILSEVEVAFLKHIQFNCNSPLGLNLTLANNQFNAKLFVANTQLTRFFSQEIKFNTHNKEEGCLKIAKLALDWIEKNDK